MSSPSSSSHATVEAATRSPDHATLSPVHAPKYPEYVTPTKDHPLLASASPITLSPDYSTDSEPIKEDLEEEPEEDPEEEPEEDPEEELEEDHEEEPNEDPEEEPKERTCFTTPSYRYEIGEISTVAAARKDAHKFYVHHEDVQNKRALVRAQISLQVMKARIETLEAQVRTLQTQRDRMEWQRQHASAFGCIHALEARDQVRPKDVKDTNSSC
nr:hypothetical protein [Tanacetum cinerariifolium]